MKVFFAKHEGQKPKYLKAHAEYEVILAKSEMKLDLCLTFRDENQSERSLVFAGDSESLDANVYEEMHTCRIWSHSLTQVKFSSHEELFKNLENITRKFKIGLEATDLRKSEVGRVPRKPGNECRILMSGTNNDLKAEVCILSLDVQTEGEVKFERMTFVCTFCQRSKFPSLAHSILHVSTCSTEVSDAGKVGLYLCYLCGKRWFELKGIKAHLLEDHKSVKCFFPCQKCKARFYLPRDITRHELLVHSINDQESENVCKICQKKFSSHSKMKRHVKSIHVASKDHVCNTCGKGFALKEKLTKHAKIHSTEKSHRCNVCGKAFKQFCNLRQHVDHCKGRKTKKLT